MGLQSWWKRNSRAERERRHAEAMWAEIVKIETDIARGHSKPPGTLPCPPIQEEPEPSSPSLDTKTAARSNVKELVSKPETANASSSEKTSESAAEGKGKGKVVPSASEPEGEDSNESSSISSKCSHGSGDKITWFRMSDDADFEALQALTPRNDDRNFTLTFE